MSEKKEDFEPSYAAFGVILTMKEGRFQTVVVDSKDVPPGRPRRGVPGGREKRQDGGNPLKTLFREIKEETGIPSSFFLKTNPSLLGTNTRPNDRASAQSSFKNYFYVIIIDEQVTLDLYTEKSDIERALWLSFRELYAQVDDRKLIKYSHMAAAIELGYWLSDLAEHSKNIQFMLADVTHSYYERPSKNGWRVNLISDTSRRTGS